MQSRVHHMAVGIDRHPCTPDCFTLPVPPVFHSTLVIVPRHTFANPNAIHKSFNLS